MKLVDLIAAQRGVMCIPLLGYPGVPLTDSTIRQNVQQPEQQWETMLALDERFRPDGQFCLMDLSVEAGALGLEVLFADMDSPTVVEHPVKSMADLDRFRGRDVLADARLQGFVETVRRMASELNTLVGGYVIGPFSLAGLLLGATEAVIATITEPELLQSTLRLATDVIKPYAQALAAAGADMVAILEPSASLLAPRQFEDYCGAYVREIVSSLRTASILHICGQTSHLLDGMAATGAQGLSLDAMVSLPDAARSLPEELVLIGNVDAVQVMVSKPPHEVYGIARDLITAMAPHRNFILSSACDLPPETPHANIDALLQAARDARGRDAHG